MTQLRSMMMANPLGAFNQGRQIGEEDRTKRTLAQHMQSALGGDQAAQSAIYGADPEAGFRVQQHAQTQQRGAKEQQLAELKQAASLYSSAPPQMRGQIYGKIKVLAEQAGIIQPNTAPASLDTPEAEQTFGKFIAAIAGDSEEPRIVAPGSALVGNDGRLIYERPFAPDKPDYQLYDGADGPAWLPKPTGAPASAGGLGSPGQPPVASGPALDPTKDFPRLASAVPGVQSTSLFRDPKNNARVGGVSNSQHMKGTAGDFVVPPAQRQQFIQQARAMGYEAIDEGDHVHVELPPGQQAANRFSAGQGLSAIPITGVSPKRKGVRRMSPEEVQQAGFRPGSIVEVDDATGSSRVVQAPPESKDASAGRPLPLGAVNALTKDAGKLANLQDLIPRFLDTFAGNKVTGGAENLVGRLGLPGATEGQADWWQQYDRYKNEVRNELFGASLTSGEQAAFRAADIEANMAPSRIRANLAKQAEIINKALERKARVWAAQGYNREAIEEATGVQLGDKQPSRGNSAAPQSPSSAAAAVQRARNPKTGEILVLRNGQWVPE